LGGSWLAALMGPPRRPAAFAVLAALAVAGCVADPPPAASGPEPFDVGTLSPKAFAVLEAEEVWVTASDGARLHNAVFRPATEEPVPVFIDFSPYWGDSAMAGGDPFGQYLVAEYVPRGYAVVLSALRGTGHSEGCFQVGGDVEVRDAYEVVDHFSKAPWSSGLVAAGGKSYDSTTQNGLVAKQPHPALRGIFHVSAITDMYGYSAKDGVVYRKGLDFTPRYFAEQGLHEYGLPTVGSGPTSSSEESPESLRRLAGDVLCPEAARHVVAGEGTAAAGLRDAYWEERSWATPLASSSWEGTVFFVHGLQDWNVKPDHIDPWLRVLQQKGVPVLAWLHQDTFNNGHVYPMRTDWNETMLRWLDATLKGKAAAMDGVWGFEVAGSDGVWRRSAAWPPAPTGELMLEVPPSAKETPAALDAPAGRYGGTPTARATVVTHTQDDIARIVLWDVAPDGTRAWVNEAVRRLALDESLHGVEPRAAGERLTVNMTFYPMDHVLAPGHKWQVELGGPAVAEESQTPPDFLYRPDQVAHVEYVDVEMVLPQASLEGALEKQPEGMPCFTC
jgi:predicted acyl esterase